MTKTITQTENSKKQSDNKNATETSMIQRLPTDEGRSIREKKPIQPLFNR